MKLFWKILIILAIFISALILSVPRKQNLKYGVTFSQKFSTELVGDDWRKNYLAILDDLKIKNLRLVAYWDILEPNENKFNFEDLDWQISEAEKRGAKIILAMGLKVPRWPECHIPEWVKGEGIAGRLIKYEEILINRYKNNKNIWYDSSYELKALQLLENNNKVLLFDRAHLVINYLDNKNVFYIIKGKI